MNKTKLIKLRAFAERTIKILNLIESGKKQSEILQEFANNHEVVSRQLVDYYIKSTK